MLLSAFVTLLHGRQVVSLPHCRHVLGFGHSVDDLALCRIIQWVREGPSDVPHTIIGEGYSLLRVGGPRNKYKIDEESVQVVMQLAAECSYYQLSYATFFIPHTFFRNLTLTFHSQYVVISTFHVEQNLPNATLNGHQLRKQFFNKCPHSEHTTSVKV